MTEEELDTPIVTVDETLPLPVIKKRRVRSFWLMGLFRCIPTITGISALLFAYYAFIQVEEQILLQRNGTQIIAEQAQISNALIRIQLVTSLTPRFKVESKDATVGPFENRSNLSNFSISIPFTLHNIGDEHLVISEAVSVNTYSCVTGIDQETIFARSAFDHEAAANKSLVIVPSGVSDDSLHVWFDYANNPDMLEDLRERGKYVVVFSQFVSHIAASHIDINDLQLLGMNDGIVQSNYRGEQISHPVFTERFNLPVWFSIRDNVIEIESDEGCTENHISKLRSVLQR